MAASSADKLQILFVELQKNYQKGEYDKALKSANKILQQSANDDKAFHCKIVCQLQLSKFEDALSHIRKNPEAAKGLGFEKAYCEYRLNRISESYKTLNGLEQRSPAANELLAQVLYRMEEFEQCYRIYREQLKNTSDDFQSERETNLSAVIAARQTWGDEDLEEFGLTEDTYEVCYNSACFLLGKGLYQEAIDKLRQAEKLCLEFFEDDPDATEEDIEAELGVIRAQMGYAGQKLGKNDEATKLYNQVLKQRPSDIALLAVVSNNIVTLNKDQNVFDSKKKIKAATVGGLQNKLVKKQREAISVNECLLLMYSNQGEKCAQTAQALQKTYPHNDVPSLIAAAQCAKEKQYEKATQILQGQIARTSSDAFSLKLSLAQLYLGQAHVDKACEVLKSLGDHSYAPAVLSALVSLYVNEEDCEAASKVLHDAVTWHSQNNPNSPELLRIMKATVDFEMTHGKPQTATALLETLSKKDPSDLKIKAQLISAYSKFDPQKAEEVSRQLPSPGDMTKDIDSAALEMAVTSFVPKYAKKSALAKGEQSPSSPRSGAGDEPLRKKHKKKKKGKLPKNHEPGSVADPERWMPLRERSTYKGRRRKNKRDVGKGTQGAAAAAGLMAELDINKGSAEAQSPRAGSAASQPQSAGPRQNKPQGAKPKKKKKGGKW